MAASCLALTAGCAEPEGATTAPFTPVYLGAKADSLDANIVQIHVEMTGARDPSDLTAYADCAIAGYADARGFGFARHVRTNVDETGGLWSADAVYTMSPALPAGVRQIDVEAQIDACNQTGIPLL
jgi:hypothetical protein